MLYKWTALYNTLQRNLHTHWSHLILNFCLREIIVLLNYFPQLVMKNTAFFLHTIHFTFTIHVSILMRTFNEYFGNIEKYQDQMIKFNKITRFRKISLYGPSDGVCNDLILPKRLLNTSGRIPRTCQRQTESWSKRNTKQVGFIISIYINIWMKSVETSGICEIYNLSSY